MTDKSSEELKSLPWSVRKRLEFIEFRLFWNGKVNRGDLTRHFNTSVPQASGDLAKYQDLAPSNLAYDRRAKEYIPGSGFEPQFISPDSSSYLAQLLAVGSGLLLPEESFISEVPRLGLMPNVTRNVAPSILKAIVSAILNSQMLEIEYQSFSAPSPKARFISPHALANDGFRWHVRSFCHTDKIYKDFVLGRIISVLKSGDIISELPPDQKWHNLITLIITANPNLSQAQINSIEFEYDMKNGELLISTRICLAEYVLKRFGIGRDSEQKEANEQHIILKNKDEVENVLGKKIFFK